MKRKKYRYIEVWQDEAVPDVVFGVYIPKLEIDLEIAKELVANRLDFTEGKPMYALIDFSNIKSVSKEAREYMNSPEGGLIGVLGGAFVSNNVVATLFINLFLRINKPTVPAKFFTDRQEALAWLSKIKETETV